MTVCDLWEAWVGCRESARWGIVGWENVEVLEFLFDFLILILLFTRARPVTTDVLLVGSTEVVCLCAVYGHECGASSG